MISLAQEHAIGSKTSMHKPRVLDQNAMKTNDLLKSKSVSARLQHCPTPPFQSCARRTLTFDLKTGAAVSQKHETRRASHELCPCAPDDLTGLACQFTCDKLLQGCCPPDHWAEARGSE